MLDENSVAARLARIRAAAANAPAAAPVAEEVEPVVEQDILAEEAEELDPIADEFEEALAEEDLAPLEAETEEIEAEILDNHADVSGDDAPEITEEDLDDLMSLDGVDDVEDVVEMSEAVALADQADAEEPDLRSLLNDIQSDDSEDSTAVLDAIDFDDDETEEVEEAPIQARILHVKGAALEEAEELNDDEMFGYDDEAYETADADIDTSSLDDIFAEEDLEETAPSSLSDEDEADLLRELAEAEADEDQDMDDDDLGDLLDAETDAVVTDEEHLFTSDPEEALASAQDLSSLLKENEADEEVDRLLAETETQMSEPDNSRRRTMISHLKAAFAAKKADQDAGLDEDSGNDSEPYANDLAMSVKPRRPILGSARGAREVAQESAPLRLVAEQKIVPDENKSEPAARPSLVRPVRPRRIQAGNAAVAEDVADAVAESEVEGPQPRFEDFAAHMGIDKLPELLEAAASYITFVVGLEKFSRPQVMTLVREQMGEDYTREDGLRAFGQLLREGKIIRLEGGRFTVSDGIGYQPDE